MANNKRDISEDRLDDEGRYLVEKYRSKIVGAVVKTFNAKYIIPGYIDRDDCIAEGIYGLCTAAARWRDYCAEKGYEYDEKYFFAYAVRRAKGAVVDEIRRRDSVSRSVRGQIKRGEISEELPENMRHAVVMDEEEWGKVHARQPSMESSLSAATMLQVVQDTIRGLKPQAQVVLALHYFQGIELAEIAKMLGVTESRISDLHSNAVVEVKAALVEHVKGWES